ncbi:hypothetical protein BC829DRAFT_383812 [Chytridium lagenaria]|nr:hypothetical protein BC829DRAFT_383812 [Chytridium lagenaria]
MEEMPMVRDGKEKGVEVNVDARVTVTTAETAVAAAPVAKQPGAPEEKEEGEEEEEEEGALKEDDEDIAPPNLDGIEGSKSAPFYGGHGGDSGGLRDYEDDDDAPYGGRSGNDNYNHGDGWRERGGGWATKPDLRRDTYSSRGTGTARGGHMEHNAGGGPPTSQPPHPQQHASTRGGRGGGGWAPHGHHRGGMTYSTHRASESDDYGDYHGAGYHDGVKEYVDERGLPPAQPEMTGGMQHPYPPQNLGMWGGPQMNAGFPMPPPPPQAAYIPPPPQPPAAGITHPVPYQPPYYDPYYYYRQ